MSEIATAAETKETAILQYYYFKDTSIKLVRKDDRYLVIYRKFTFLHFRKIKKYEFENYCEAEDFYLELKLELLFEAGVTGLASF